MRAKPSAFWKTAAIFVIGAGSGILASVQVIPAGSVGSGTEQGPGPAGPGAVASFDPGAAGPSAGPSQVAALDDGPSGLKCAPGLNGGATDKGVTATAINLATTVVRSGPGAAFLADVQIAMEAVVNKVNHAGGICGRQLVVTYRDDGWNSSLGQKYLRNFMQDEVFAIPVGPSSEGLNAVAKDGSGEIDEEGIPVVGTDGMLISQYTDPWFWPVAVSTASSARLMVIQAAKKLGITDFAIVFDKNYKFGVEAAQAFNAEVKRQTGKDVEGFNEANTCKANFCGVEAAQPTYATEINRFTGGGPNSLVAMFLEPATALTWMGNSDSPKPDADANALVWGAQPLFTRDFGVKCQSACDGVTVWTGYRPNIEEYQYEPALRTYVADLRATDPNVDVFNQFAQGGYVGMQLLVEALQKVGPHLTRDRLRAVLDSMTLKTGLTVDPKLRWAEENHYAAACMQGFTINYKGTFGGWRTGATSCDPHPEYGTN
ncbi:MAG TPA: ABC transporter substrate-binding protein [Actinomycetota bacterium]